MNRSSTQRAANTSSIEDHDDLIRLVAAYGARHDPGAIRELARRHVSDVDGWCAWCGLSNDAPRSRWPCRPARMVATATEGDGSTK